MKSTKQTALQWLMANLEQHGSTEALILDWETLDELIAAAISMEREQIEEAYTESRCEWNEIKSCTEYYTDTYGA